MLFPMIDSLEEFKAKVAHLPEIRFNTMSNGYTVICYMISDNDTFSGESAPWARECRGITFDREGKIASRSFHKFFNVGERADTQADIFDREDVVTVMDKRDGCCDGNVKVLTLEGEKTIRCICETKYMGPIVGYDNENKCQIVSYIIDHSILDNNNDWYEIELENGSKIKLTGNHLVWVSNKNKYIPVRELLEQDEVVLSEEDC